MSKLTKIGTWALPVVLTVIAVAWAVAAIGDILTAQAHPAFAYSVAVLYDAVWLYGLAMETAHRRQGSSARLPQVIGWTFLPLTVVILGAHGLLAGDILAAAVGALVPVLAKMTLVMAIDRDTTRISARAQAAIDRARAVTRDRIAVSRAVAEARADETRAAARIVKRSRKAEADAAVTAFEAFEKYAETLDRHPVPDWHTDLPALVSDHELEALLSGGRARRSIRRWHGGFRPPRHGWRSRFRHAPAGRPPRGEQQGRGDARRGAVRHRSAAVEAEVQGGDAGRDERAATDRWLGRDRCPVRP